MKCVFDKCHEAVSRANDMQTFGFYYSEMHNSDSAIHIHDCCEVLLCVHGGKSFLINDRVYDVQDGDVFIINQFEAHKITFDGGTSFCRYVMQVHPRFLYEMSTVETNLAYCFYARGKNISNKLSLTAAERTALIDKIVKMREENAFGDDIIKTNAAKEILVMLNSAFIRATKKQTADVYNRTINNAMDYINSNYRGNLTLEKIAENSYVSVNQLCRLFNRYCGTTVARYITSKRITEAKKSLLSGKSVTQAALECGFEDYANFIRVFKKHVGVTPGKYSKV